MGQFSSQGHGLTPIQVKTFKLSVSAACRRMTADQILDIADHLHAIIRKRSAGCVTTTFTGPDTCANRTTAVQEMSQ